MELSSAYFTHLRIPSLNPPRGLFLHNSLLLANPFHEFVSLSLGNQIPEPFQMLCFVDDLSGIRILQSCNGLMLCCSYRARVPDRNYYIFNPTTQQFITLEKPADAGGEGQISKVVLGMTLAFDLWKSPHYKVVCVRMSELAHEPQHYQIEIYSSETKKWRVSGPSFPARPDINFAFDGVYWNDGIYWPCGNNSLCFNIKEEKLERFTMPCNIRRSWDEDDGESRIAYYGESCGHLHLVQVRSRQKLTFYNVYEMKSDGSKEWFLKYQVNVEDVVAAFPRIIRRYLEPTDWRYFAMAVLCVVTGEKEEDASFLVLYIPNRVICYNLRDCTFYKLCEFGKTTDDNIIIPFSVEDMWHVPLLLEYDWSTTFQYIESVFSL